MFPGTNYKIYWFEQWELCVGHGETCGTWSRHGTGSKRVRTRNKRRWKKFTIPSLLGIAASQFQNKENLCSMCFPLEMLRQFVATLSEESSKGPPNTESLPPHSTDKGLDSHTPWSSTTAVRVTAHALSSLALSDDQIARQLGLQAHGTSTISSSISTVTREYWNTSKWEDTIGVATLDMKFRDNSTRVVSKHTL